MPEPVNKKRHPFLAAIATFGAFGLGQLYNGKPKKAAVAYLLWLGAAIFTIAAPLSSSLGWLLAAVSLPILTGSMVIIDAVRDARAQQEVTLHRYNRWYVYLGIILILGLLVNRIWADLTFSAVKAYKIPTQSMSPTLELGDHLIVDMKAYQTNEPQRGDLIVFKYPMIKSVPYVKRLIGLPGETIEIRNRMIYVNGNPLIERYVQYTDPNSISEHYGPYNLAHGEYFVLGDNRDNSQDSRYWGPVKKSLILGQARYLYWAKDRSRIGKKVS